MNQKQVRAIALILLVVISILKTSLIGKFIPKNQLYVLPILGLFFTWPAFSRLSVSFLMVAFLSMSVTLQLLEDPMPSQLNSFAVTSLILLPLALDRAAEYVDQALFLRLLKKTLMGLLVISYIAWSLGLNQTIETTRYFGIPASTGIFTNPAIAGYAYLFSFMAGLTLLPKSKETSFLVVGFFVLIMGTVSRGVILSTVVGLSTFLLLKGDWKFSPKSLFFSLVTLLLLGPALVLKTFSKGSSNRIEIWSGIIEKMSASWQSWVFGLGPQGSHIQLITGHFSPESSYFEALGDYGLIFLAVMLTLLAFIALEAWRDRQFHRLAILASALTFGVSEIVILTPPSIIWTMVILGLLTHYDFQSFKEASA